MSFLVAWLTNTGQLSFQNEIYLILFGSGRGMRQDWKHDIVTISIPVTLEELVLRLTSSSTLPTRPS